MIGSVFHWLQFEAICSGFPELAGGLKNGLMKFNVISQQHHLITFH